jgi:hypothetical protein
MPNELNTRHRNLETGNEQAVAFQRFLNRFQNVQESNNGRYHMAICPGHSDSNPSLQVRVGRDQNTIWMHCYAGCDIHRIMEAANLTWADMFLDGRARTSEEQREIDERELDYHRRAVRRTRAALNLADTCPQAKIAELAANLGVSEASLRALGIKWYTPWSAWAFPMRDGTRNAVVGYAVRMPDGRKCMIHDSRPGLFIPKDLKITDRLYICEGLSDTAAAYDLGLPAIGRFNLTQGGQEIEKIIGHSDIEVTVIPDNDRNADGTIKPKTAAIKLARQVGGTLKYLPELYKDLREYKNAGQTDLSWLGDAVPARRRTVGNGQSRGYGIAEGAIEFDDLMQMSFPVNWIVEGVMAEGEPMLIIGPDKSFKTHCGFDLDYSIATGTPFLGRFEVPTRAVSPVIMIASESPYRRHKEILKRIAEGRSASGIAVPLYTFDRVPDLTSQSCLEEIAAFASEKHAKFIHIDPAYNGMNGERAENQFMMGAQLFNIRDVFREAGCTMILSCHSRKGAGSNFDPIELRDVAWAGFSSFAGQWLLLNSRKRHMDDDGHTFQQWLGIGGRDGQSGTWGLNINEGTLEHRKWDVEVVSCSASRREDHVQGADRRRQEDEAAFLAAMTRYPHGTTKSVLRDRLSWSGQKVNAVVEALLADNRLEPYDVLAGNRMVAGIRIPGNLI